MSSNSNTSPPPSWMTTGRPFKSSPLKRQVQLLPFGGAMDSISQDSRRQQEDLVDEDGTPFHQKRVSLKDEKSKILQFEYFTAKQLHRPLALLLTVLLLSIFSLAFLYQYLSVFSKIGMHAIYVSTKLNINFYLGFFHVLFGFKFFVQRCLITTAALCPFIIYKKIFKPVASDPSFQEPSHQAVSSALLQSIAMDYFWFYMTSTLSALSLMFASGVHNVLLENITFAASTSSIFLGHLVWSDFQKKMSQPESHDVRQKDKKYAMKLLIAKCISQAFMLTIIFAVLRVVGTIVFTR